MARFTSGDERARLGGLALQAKLRQEKERAARQADLEAALRTIYMLTLSATGTDAERLAHIRLHAAAVLGER